MLVLVGKGVVVVGLVFTERGLMEPQGLVLSAQQPPLEKGVLQVA